MTGQKGMIGGGAASSMQEALLFRSPDAVLFIGSDWRVSYANQRAAQIANVRSDQIEGAVFWEAFPEFATEANMDSCRRALDQKNGVEFEVTVSPGSWFHVCVDPYETGIALYCRDIRAEKASVELQELLGAIVHSSDDAIISKDLNGVITSWNKTAERLFGWTAEEAIGKTVADVLIPEDRQEEESAILSKLRRGERVDHFQTKRKRKDGTLLDISLTISPVKDASGRIVGASKIARDITELVSNQEALKRSNADLEHFAYSASHDLQEPLRMVSIYAELLRKKYGGSLDVTAEEYLGFVIEGGARMERLLRDLRAYTHILLKSDGDASADARSVLDSSLANLRPAIEESGAEIIVGELPTVSIHEFQLEQLFQNIIGNAIRYRSGARLRIQVNAERDGGAWRFSIADNGIGIDPEYKENIFGLFTRLHTTEEYPGTGMGLAICQRIVERAGGRIWVESQRGKGSTFYFLLPGCGDGRSRSLASFTPNPSY